MFVIKITGGKEDENILEAEVVESNHRNEKETEREHLAESCKRELERWEFHHVGPDPLSER